jgi:hypothetical protein
MQTPPRVARIVAIPLLITVLACAARMFGMPAEGFEVAFLVIVTYIAIEILFSFQRKQT